MKLSYLEVSMSSIFRSPFVGTVLLLLVLPLLSACTPDASAAIISPNLGEVEVVAKAIEEDIRLGLEPTPVPVVVTLDTMTDEEISAGLPEGVALALASAIPSDAEVIITGNACAGCHSLEEGEDGQGPNWYNLGNRAIDRAAVAGNEGPAAYLYESISNPGAYVVDGFADGLMPQTYADTLSDEDFGALISYILAQRGE